MRGVTVSGNKGAIISSDTNRSDNSGLVLEGNASSSFDLGTAADPGLNTFSGNVTGANTSNLWVAVDGAVVVSAVGNTWDANIQGASGSGQYALGVAPCDLSGCDVGSGTDGDNFTVTSGILRLVE